MMELSPLVLGDLLDDRILAVGLQGEAGGVLVQGLADGEAVNIEATAAEQAGNPRQHPRFVLQQYRNGMSHKLLSFVL